MTLGATGTAQAASRPAGATASATAPTPPVAYVSNYTSESISEIDTATGAVTGTVSTAPKHGTGTFPQSEYVSPDGKTVWVQNAGSGNITVIDAKTHKAIDMIHVCVNPGTLYPLVFTPDGSHAYMICNANSLPGAALFDIDGTTRTVTRVAAVAKPLNIAASPDSTKLFVTADKSLMVLDTATDTVSATIPLRGIVNRDSDAIAVSKDGTHVYAGLYNGVAVVDATTNTVAATITLGIRINQLALTADGSTLLAAPARGKDLYEISTATNTVSGDVFLGGTDASQLAASPTDSSTAYIEVQHTGIKNLFRIVKLNLRTRTVTVAASLKSPSNFITFSPDGRTVYASANETDTLLALDAATGNVAEQVPLGMQHIGDVVYANDQAFVSVGDGTGTTPGEVWVLNADTYKEITAVEPVKQTPYQLVATPNGQTVYAVGRGEIIALDTATGTTSYIQVPGDPEALAVSPDGTALYAADANSSAVHIISTATEKIINMFTVPYITNEPASPATYRAMAFSPDGRRLYVTGTAMVSVVDTATDTVTSTIAVGGVPRQIAVSPNGTLVYLSPVVGTTVTVIDTATNAVSNVSLSSRAGAIAFTPDGSKAYVVDEDDSVAVIDTATGTETGTIAAGQDPDAVAFTPDGTEAYVTDGDFGQVSVISTATGTVTSTLSVGTYPTAVAIAP